MQLRLFLIFILSHLIGDFVIQSQSVCNQRFPKKMECGKQRARKSIIKGNLIHSLLHAILLVFLILLFLQSNSYDIYGGGKLGLCYISILVFINFFSHFMIDCSKSWLAYEHMNLEFNLYFFLGDQLLHLMIILGLFSRYIKDWLNKLLLSMDTEGYINQLERVDKILISGIVITFSTFFAGIFIKIFMEHLDFRNKVVVKISQEKVHKKKVLPKNMPKSLESSEGATQEGENEIDGEMKQGGYIIGILERFFILGAMMISTPQLIGFMLTVKSIVRLKKMSKDKFAEYFLIGNLLSFLFAIIPGVLLQKLL